MPRSRDHAPGTLAFNGRGTRILPAALIRWVMRPVLAPLALLVSCHAVSAVEMREAPATGVRPVNQLAVAGNACGPAALLNAFRFGSPAWRRAADAVPGTDDKQRVQAIIRTYGMRPSPHLGNRPRWSRRGVSLADLTDMGGEMIHGHFLPPLSQEVFFLTERETPEKLLARAHKRLEKSLAKGLPPVLSIRRYAHRRIKGKPPAWVVVEAHFVTITAVPRKLPRGQASFPVRYIDPWGGRPCEGAIRIPETTVLAPPGAPSPCLEADFPQAAVGKKLVRPGEATFLCVSAAIGRW